MKFKINNKTWYIKELSQEQMKEELKKQGVINTDMETAVRE